MVNSYCRERDGNEDCNLPIMSLHERVLSVLGCKHVDDVVIDAPFVITRDMVNSLNISVVIVNNEGKSMTTLSRSQSSNNLNINTDTLPNPNLSPNTPQDPYSVVKQLGLVQHIDYIQHEALSVAEIIMRINSQHQRYKTK